MQYETKFCVNCATALQWKVMAEDSGEVSRLRCPACGWTHWGNPTPVLAAVVENDLGQVLLARNALWQPGMFGLITGFMEAGESPEAGIAREVLEETGLQTQALRLIGCWEFLRMNQVLIAYHVRVAGRPEDVRLSPELVEYQWQTAQEVLCWPSGTGYAMAEWVKSKGEPVRFGAFRPNNPNPNPDPAKWPVNYWEDDARFVVAPRLD
ncbi:NUDIX domain-containing protein [Comamonas sp. 23]|uniref:NUDIX domain-containing protein n=1 Tax=Comamonas sp. 23 TaxID=3415008 RepID=UPI003C6FFF0E